LNDSSSAPPPKTSQAPTLNDSSSAPPPPRTSQAARIEQWITLAALAMLVVGCYFVLQPFLSAVLLAAILCFTTWPLFLHLQRFARGNVTLAAMMITLAVAFVVLAPFVIVGISLADNANQLLEQIKRLIDEGPPDPPPWVGQIPLIGEWVRSYWAGFAHDGAGALSELKQYAQPIRTFAIASGTALGRGVVELTLSILVAFFFYRDGERIAAHLTPSLDRIAGYRGRHYVDVAVATMRGVVYGLLGTAIAQGVLAAIGFWLAGVPAAPLLGLLTFFLSPVPVGPPLVWVPAAFWLFNHGETGWAIFMLIWGTGVVSTIDNILKPLIISQGSDLPFILVLLGVLGGVIAFGFIGVFLGPTLLAIGFALIQDWSENKNKAAADIV
jgi:predicted PurR-regulated permease PerM